MIVIVDQTEENSTVDESSDGLARSSSRAKKPTEKAKAYTAKGNSRATAAVAAPPTATTTTTCYTSSVSQSSFVLI